MTLRIFLKTDKQGNKSLSYLDKENVVSWSASAALLMIELPTGLVQYYPLQNVESFVELPEAE